MTSQRARCTECRRLVTGNATRCWDCHRNRIGRRDKARRSRATGTCDRCGYQTSGDMCRDCAGLTAREKGPSVNPNSNPLGAEPWRELAACRGADRDMWFPRSNDATVPPKAICSTCPVKRECLETALEHNEVGIWGGTADAERQRIKRQRNRSNAS